MSGNEMLKLANQMEVHGLKYWADKIRAATASAVPVAWRTRWKTGSERDREWEMWSYHTEHPTVADTRIIEPLYTHPAPDAEPVRCYGCGSSLTDEELREMRKTDPLIISCCPERKPLTIDQWQKLALANPAPDAEIVAALDDQIEAGAQALINDHWHPPQPLSVLNKSEANRYRRLARLVLEAALAKAKGGPQPAQHVSLGSDEDDGQRGKHRD